MEQETSGKEKMTHPPATIMIVEDEEDLARLLEYRLGKEGFKTVIAREGKEACRLLPETDIDLVLLDILMPGMDGWEVCRWIRGQRDSRVASTPVIMLTALSTVENRIKGLECGADVYLAKPYSILEVILSCRRLIAQQRERFRLREELKTLRNKEEEGVETQRILFHELRSQFAVIGGLCRRMLKSDDPLHLSELARDRGYLEMIRRSVVQISDMADEMLLISKLRSDDLSLKVEDCNLSEIVEEVLPIYQEKARQKKVGIAVSPLPRRPVRLHRISLKVILSSLLENAVKYCPAASVITLGVLVAGGSICLEVADQGPGIPLSEQEQIFEPYYRGEAVRSSHHGTGLGLYSVKRLTKALGGEVTLRSSPGNGSLFRVVFADRGYSPLSANHPYPTDNKS
jgi:signal transduction histidine kinase